MRAEGPTPAGELVAARVIGARPSLKADQREMVRRLLTSPEGVAVVIGEAGTGKTFAIVASAQGWAQAGTPLRAAAPTWRAANVLRDEGLPATSIASLLVELDRAEHEGGDGLGQGSVLLIDEAGMVDSATLARLISHAERSEAKLILIGDPEQLGEIEAGGMFRAVADRSDPIYLDQVIRHRHDLDREAARRIREGEGREALGLYVSEERVTVAPDAEARREAMVADWQESFERGEDAVMIAKRNAEVQRLNELARAVRREAGKLGTEEIEVGEARFAAGDQVITRVNDHAAQIYNRERWQVEAVDAERQKVVLGGIDQVRTVELDASYLHRTNPYNDAPALEHAYAVTTYSAQGATVDRAFVMADPSMDKQELYVAASRAREQTHLYATPEVEVHREEIAPASPYLREGIPHIAEASERDRAQLAAHDQALASKFSGLPTEELAARRAELIPAAQREQEAERSHERLQRELARARESIERFEARRAEALGAPKRERGHELASIEAALANNREALERLESQGAPAVQHTARRELAAAEQVLDERLRLAVLAARLSPPDYITKELGERPSERAKARSWDRGVGLIEGYRQEHGIKDSGRAFGAKPNDSAERAARKQAQRQLQRLQRDLGRGKQLGRSRDSGRSLGIGR
jgi:hypothetical protein